MKTRIVVFLLMGGITLSLQGCMTYAFGNRNSSPGEIASLLALDTIITPAYIISQPGLILQEKQSNMIAQAAKLRHDQIIASIKIDHRVAVNGFTQPKPDPFLVGVVDESIKSNEIVYTDDELIAMFEVCPPLRATILGWRHPWNETQLERLYRIYIASTPTPHQEKARFEGQLYGEFASNHNTPDWILEDIFAGKPDGPVSSDQKTAAMASLVWRKSMHDVLGAINSDHRIAIKNCGAWKVDSPEMGALTRSLADRSIAYTDDDIAAVFQQCHFARTAIVRYRAKTAQVVQHFYISISKDAVPTDPDLFPAIIANPLTPDWILSDLAGGPHMGLTPNIRSAAQSELERRAVAKQLITP